jgi:hypothetical protein
MSTQSVAALNITKSSCRSLGPEATSLSCADDSNGNFSVAAVADYRHVRRRITLMIPPLANLRHDRQGLASARTIGHQPIRPL